MRYVMMSCRYINSFHVHLLISSGSEANIMHMINTSAKVNKVRKSNCCITKQNCKKVFRNVLQTLVPCVRTSPPSVKNEALHGQEPFMIPPILTARYSRHVCLLRGAGVVMEYRNKQAHFSTAKICIVILVCS